MALEKEVCSIVKEQDVDMVILAESNLTANDLLPLLNGRTTRLFRGDKFKINRKISIFHRLPAGSLRPIEESRHFVIREVRLPLCQPFIILAAHFPSKLHQEPEDHLEVARKAVKSIDKAERKAKHQRSVVVGDLNMNPFEPGVISAAGFNAAMTRHRALKCSRRVNDDDYRFFYNPMWSKFGERSHECPPGTFHYEHSSFLSYYWNIFDQVLLRPELLGNFDEADLKIIKTCNGKNLINNHGLPDREFASDHLPILFKLNINIT